MSSSYILFTVTSILIPTPMFTEVTTITISITEPQVRVNVSDMGAPTSGTDTLVSSKPLSQLHSPETETVIGRAEMEFDSIYYCPYRV